MNLSHQQPLQQGFMAFHGNRSETLAELLIGWMRRNPLGPLEEEVILVQSNGMAEWIKMEMARHGGVCAATRVELPSRFLWRTYRQVLGPEAVPAESPLDKLPMVWRLMQLLPGLVSAPEFAPVAGFLRSDEPDRWLQLASKLADLFDQYQNYRADWLDAWSRGHDQLVHADGAVSALPPEQQWQPPLWRAVLATLDAAQVQGIRPALHQRVIARLTSGEPLAGRVARRVSVFGMSQMPLSTLQALAALSSHSQVLLAIPNPCRYYWGDIMEGRELLRSLRRRQTLRGGKDLSQVPLEDMHAHAHPLLAAWGRTGRDFIRQLDRFDDAQQSQQTFGLARIDVFDETPEDAQTPLLKQVQNRIRDLTPLSEHVRTPLVPDDRSVVFHTAHSALRELEILHDQLLELLADAATGAPLRPRDVVVMVPDINPLAPAIRAVFGQYPRSDARFIPFDIADLGARSSSPLIEAVGWLLRLPQQRCRLSELVDLLEVPAVAARFGIDIESMPRLKHWMAGAGIRWGLNAGHRVDLGLGACGDQNSAWFGLRRMLLGFASGAVGVDDPLPCIAQIDPYAEIGGLEAELAGALAHLLQALVVWQDGASTAAPPATWVLRCRSLLAAMMRCETDTDKQALRLMEEGLWAWQSACEAAGFVADVPLSVARAAWLEALEEPRLNQRFQAGGVTFCTLMPMRAIPFEVVCLLGLNEGDYPRRGIRNDFDLMGLPCHSRPGDRSRREDDRALVLEALLSARRTLYISWCGHSMRDNSPQPPSILVSQLRDYLAAGWGSEAVARRTTEHPLQPFSRRYFAADSGLRTYAKEWRAAHETADHQHTAAQTPPWEPAPGVPLTLGQLGQFLRNPVKAFFRQRLQVVFEDTQSETTDEENFSLDGLQSYTLLQQLLVAATQSPDAAQQRRTGQRALDRLHIAGQLPLKIFGELASQDLSLTMQAMLTAWDQEHARYPQVAPRQAVRVQEGAVVLEDWIDHPRVSALSDDPQTVSTGTQRAWLELQPGNLLVKVKKDYLARPEKLLAAWVRSLAASASGTALAGVLVGRDGVVQIRACEHNWALDTLRRLLRLWQRGMAAPIPLPPETALAWLLDRDAAAHYEGGYMLRGELEDPCLSRVFPTFEALIADGQFESDAREIYAPLLDWIATHVTVRPHGTADLAIEGTP